MLKQQLEKLRAGKKTDRVIRVAEWIVQELKECQISHVSSYVLYTARVSLMDYKNEGDSFNQWSIMVYDGSVEFRGNTYNVSVKDDLQMLMEVLAKAIVNYEDAQL